MFQPNQTKPNQTKPNQTKPTFFELATVSCFFLICAIPAQAKLVDRGGGLLYDDVLGVTFLQDANYALTTGYSAPGVNIKTGQMTWAAANTWAKTLVYHNPANNTDYIGWQLASNSPVNGASFNYTVAKDGSTDLSFNISSPNSMLMYMYYVNLGLTGLFDKDGFQTATWGVNRNGVLPPDKKADIGLIRNLQTDIYWSATPYDATPGEAFVGSMSGGGQGHQLQSKEYFAWAVNKGDVAALPTSATVCLLNWAEKNYPQLFAPKASVNQVQLPYAYRYYKNTNAYVGVSAADNHVYYLGSNGILQDVGTLTSWLKTAGCSQ